MTTPVAVIGAHGKTGRAVTAALQRRDVEVRGLGRAELIDPVEALRGCNSLYLIAPNMYADEQAFVRDALAAATAAGIAKVVYHSVALPYAPSMPHHMGKAAGEQLIRQLDISWSILQPGPYLQNFVAALQSKSPTLDQPYDVSKLFNFVDLADVAEAAATALLDHRHDGATYELGGPERMSVADLAGVASDVLGTPVSAARIDPTEWASTQGAGLEPRVRDWLLAMFAYYDDHGLPLESLPLSRLLGRPATGAADCLRRELHG